jgi:hypothetical protein
METALKNFFTSPRFAVVGASSDPAKFGHKGKSLQVESGLSSADKKGYGQLITSFIKCSLGISLIPSP